MTTPITTALKDYYIERPLVLEVPTGILNRFWVQVAVSLLPHSGFRSKTAVTVRSRFRSEMVTNLYYAVAVIQ
jgi:hypothetical protein